MHADHKNAVADGHQFTVHYTPAESDTGLFGGNSNWRGPIWMPVTFLLVEAIRKFHAYYGECDRDGRDGQGRHAHQVRTDHHAQPRKAVAEHAAERRHDRRWEPADQPDEADRAWAAVRVRVDHKRDDVAPGTDR